MRRTSGVLIAVSILWACATGARAGDAPPAGSPSALSPGASVAPVSEAVAGAPGAVTPLVAPPPGAVAPTSAAVPALSTPPEVATKLTPKSAANVSTPIAKRWWFWAGLGAAAIAVVVTAIAMSPREAYTGNVQPGVVQVF